MMNDTFARITSSGDTDALLSLSRDEKDDFLNELMYGQLCDMPLSENEEVFLALPDAANAEDSYRCFRAE